jgi:hypothetical protein
MSIHEMRADDDVIRRFCASRGYGADHVDFLLQRAKDRRLSAESLQRSRDMSVSTRISAVSERWCEEQVVQMNDRFLG